MKITEEQWNRIKQVNDSIKDLDPILKERIIDYELSDLLKDDYVKIASFAKKNILQNIKPEAIEIEKQLPTDRSDSIPTLKEFYDDKKPSSITETVAVFGFYLEHFRNKAEFSEVDISEAYFEAKVRKPKAIGQALRDAKNLKGYLVEGGKRGSFRLSNVGENLVLHDLPKMDVGRKIMRR